MEEKSATTLELFFDLVFVFAITQVVYALAHHLTWNGAAQATILLGVMWWGWAGWTWTTNLVSRWTHFPMIVGVVFSAVALEEVFAHPDDHLHTFVNHVLAIGVAAFFGGMAAAAWRASKIVLIERLAAIGAALAIIYGFPDMNGRAVVVAVIAVLVTALIAEDARLAGRRTQRLTPAADQK